MEIAPGHYLLWLDAGCGILVGGQGYRPKGPLPPVQIAEFGGNVCGKHSWLRCHQNLKQP